MIFSRAALKEFALLLITTALASAWQDGRAQSASFLPELTPVGTTREFTFEANDSTTCPLQLAYDAEGIPAYFYSNVFTPVCFTEVCKPVYIDLYWDLLGNYIGYEVPSQEPLTKTDHKEFEAEDYKHLHDILSNSASLLKEFSIFDLVDTRTYQLSDSVDAVTGATPKTIQAEVISGAVYTCFTLWHITHGNVVSKIQEITERSKNDALLHHFLRSDNHHYQYWAMERVITGGSVRPEFLRDILSIVEGRNIFAARYALSRLPDEHFTGQEKNQEWLWNVYSSGSYALQLTILDKLKTIPLSDTLSIALAEAMRNANEEQFIIMLQLLSAQKQLPEKSLTVLGEFLVQPGEQKATQVYAALKNRPVASSDLKKKLRQFEKMHPEPTR